MADEGLRRRWQKTNHCSRCRADAPGAQGGGKRGRQNRPIEPHRVEHAQTR